MTDTINLVMSNQYLEDMAQGTSTASVIRRSTDGTQVEVTRTEINDSNFPRLSAATLTLLGLAGEKYPDDAFAAIATGVGIPVATTSTGGKVKVDHNSGGDPVAITQSGAGSRIPTTAQDTALDAETADYRNRWRAVTRFLSNEFLQENADCYGTGKDGPYGLGAITNPSTAPSGLSTSTTGGYLAAATYTYKITFGNATGETTPSSASSGQATTGSTSTITMTIPVGGSGTTWRKIYRDTGTGTYRFVAQLNENTTTSFTDGVANATTAAPGSNTTAASWSNPSGEYHFDGDASIGALTVATSGNMQGTLILRVRGNVTITGAISANGAFPANAGPTGGISLTDLTQIYFYGTGSNGPTGKSIAAAASAAGGLGYGSNQAVFHVGQQGRGGTGSAGAAGGAQGGIIVICAYSITVDTGGSITSNGSAGTAGTGGSNHSGGGGGSGGLIVLKVRDTGLVKATTSVTATGGAGGAAATAGAGGNYVGGGGGGGGGYVYTIGEWLNSGTISAAGGAGGNNTSTAATSIVGAGGGGYAGAGGAGGTASTSTASAGSSGQTISSSIATGWRSFPALGGLV